MTHSSAAASCSSCLPPAASGAVVATCVRSSPCGSVVVWLPGRDGPGMDRAGRDRPRVLTPSDSQRHVSCGRAVYHEPARYWYTVGLLTAGALCAVPWCARRAASAAHPWPRAASTGPAHRCLGPGAAGLGEARCEQRGTRAVCGPRQERSVYDAARCRLRRSAIMHAISDTAQIHIRYSASAVCACLVSLRTS